MTRLPPLVARRLLCAPLLSILAFAGCAPDENPTEPTAGGDEVTQPSFALASNSWAARANAPTGRHAISLGVAKNSAGRDIVYSIGGYVLGTPSSNVANTVTAYDYASNSWSSKAPMPAGLAQSNGVVNIGGKLYVSGGVREIPGDKTENLPYLFVYDPLRNSWSRKADLPRASSHGQSGVIGGKLYVASFGRLYRYNPATNKWSTLAPPPHSHLTGAGGVIKGKFYLAGGADYGDKANELDVYDPATNRWTAKAPMPTPRMWMSGSVLNNKLYVIGGRELATVEAYDPATNKWTTKKPMLTAREQLGVATFVTPSGNPKILAVGGWEYRKVNEMYTP